MTLNLVFLGQYITDRIIVVMLFGTTMAIGLYIITLHQTMLFKLHPSYNIYSNAIVKW